jgi:Cft2 family RNA processing exonuclease
MRITLLGASGGEVTGSAYLLQTDRAKVLINCGLFQGARKLENFNRFPQRGPLGDWTRSSSGVWRASGGAPRGMSDL